MEDGLTTEARSQALTRKYKIDAADLRTRLDWVRLSEEDLALIRAVAPLLDSEADDLAREFYEHSFKFEGFVQKVNEAGSNRRRLESAQAGYFRDILSGHADLDHFERALYLGENHTRLDVKPRWVLGNYAMYAELVLDRLSRHLQGEQLTRTFLAFIKLFSLDGSLLTEAYVGAMLDRMTEVYERLGPSAGSLADSAGQVSLAAGEIAKAIQQVATSATQQTAVVQGAVDASESIKSAMTSVAESARTAGERSGDSLSAAEQGRLGARETTEAMENINAAVLATSRQIEELSASGKEIGAITQTIAEIAAQTNLLALNAAIEAARAGDMGRGFAVVAEEVRSLAERAASAAKDITGLIQKVQTGVGQSVESMGNVVRDVDSGAVKARNAAELLEQIVHSSEQLSQDVQAIERLASEADESAQALVGSMSEIGALAETNAAASEEVSAGTEEVTAQVGDMSNQADLLNEISGELGQFLAWIGHIEEDRTQARRAA